MIRGLENRSDLSVREPTFFRNDKVRNDGENCNETENGAGKVEILCVDGEFEGREKDGEEVG